MKGSNMEYAPLRGTQTIQRAPGQRRPGRKKAFGTIDFTAGHMTYMLGYCEDGHKVLVDRETLEATKRAVARAKRSFRYRLVLRLLAHYE